LLVGVPNTVAVTFPSTDEVVRLHTKNLQPMNNLLVDLTPCGQDSLLLVLVIRLVVPTQGKNPRSMTARQHGARVAHIRNVAHVAYDERHNCASPRLVLDLVVFNGVCFEPLAFGFGEAAAEGFFRVAGETILLDDHLVQVISEEISALVTTMAVINSEEAAFGPLFALHPRELLTLPRRGSIMLLVEIHLAKLELFTAPCLGRVEASFACWRLCDVQNNGDAVFVIIPHKTAICVGRVRPHQPIPLPGCLSLVHGDFGGKDDLAGWLEGEFFLHL